MKSRNLAILFVFISGSIGLMAGVLVSSLAGSSLAASCTPGITNASSSMWVMGLLFIAVPGLGAVLGGMVGWFFLKQIKDQVFNNGHCSNCGYDLRGLRSNACPECGLGIKVAPTTEDLEAHA